MATCQRCRSDRVDYPRKGGAGAYCEDCGMPYEPWEGEPSPPQVPQAKRARTSDAANDIENAFQMWLTYAANTFNDQYVNEASKAKTRATAWLAQVAAEQRQLHAALLACQALDEANDDVDVRRATALARIAIGAK